MCELWAREDGIPDLEAAKKYLEEYFALAPKSHFQYETAIFTQSRVLKAAELLKSRDTSYANQFHRSMADVTRCNACNLVKAKLYMCSGCKVARYWLVQLGLMLCVFEQECSAQQSARRKIGSRTRKIAYDGEKPSIMSNPVMKSFTKFRSHFLEVEAI